MTHLAVPYSAFLVEELLILILEFYSQVLVFSEHDLLQISPKLASDLPLKANFPAVYCKENEFIMPAICEVQDKFFVTSSDCKVKCPLLEFLIIKFVFFQCLSQLHLNGRLYSLGN